MSSSHVNKYSVDEVESWKKTFDTAVSASTTLSTETPTPIPLRTLTTLLNYERCVSDTRFYGCKLLQSTFADPTLFDRIGSETRQKLLEDKPESVTDVHLHMFRIDAGDELTGTPSTNDDICVDAEQEVHDLPFDKRELIYHESRGHDGCYFAIGMYQHFFEFCPPGQMLSIQLRSETPVLVSPSTFRILEFNLKGPKLLTISTGMRADGHKRGGTIFTGCDEESLHSVPGFSGPGSRNVDFVVDMTRMQWGEAGRGRAGEPYYLGDLEGYFEIMRNVCDDIEESVTRSMYLNPSKHTDRFRACARRAWERWNNRDNESWCDYCGVGASERRLLGCGACKETKVRYCCKEHQKAAWKLHKLTCEKNKKK